MSEIELLEMQIAAVQRDISKNGDGFIGFDNRTRKSVCLKRLQHLLWILKMQASEADT